VHCYRVQTPWFEIFLTHEGSTLSAAHYVLTIAELFLQYTSRRRFFPASLRTSHVVNAVGFFGSDGVHTLRISLLASRRQPNLRTLLGLEFNHSGAVASSAAARSFTTIPLF
jgi:hypothetical protein